jgi:hypothetical protein
MPENRYGFEFYPDRSDQSLKKEFKTLEEAVSALNLIADYTLFLHEILAMPSFSNMGILLWLDDSGEWVEIDENGEEI